MRRDVACLVLRMLAYAMPLLALAAIGILWLVEHEHWLPFGLALAAASGVLLTASRLLGRSAPRPRAPPPAHTWPEAGIRAWDDVDRLAVRAAAAPPPFADMAAYQTLAMEVLDTVGRHFHPASKSPRLELTLSQLLEISERALRDMRTEVIDAVPVVRNLTLAHIAWAHQAREWVPRAVRASRLAMFANRIRRWVFAWPVAVANELVMAFDMSPLAIAGRQVSHIAADLFVRHVGTYAIQAFSGQASLDVAAIHMIAPDAPLRILLLGPVNAGKSSLLNAMFGQERATHDILPCPALREEHVFDREGAPRAIILDSDGFSGPGDEAARQRIFGAIDGVDLIIAVTSARQAARQVECTTLEAIRRQFAGATRRACPPIIVAATHIDQLRPAPEWNPPYDFLDGDSPKELSVRHAVDAIATDFQIALDRVIPVSLLSGAAYNVEESLLPALGAALPEADRAKFLRLVEADRSAEARDRVARSISLLAKTGRSIIDSFTRKARR